MYFKSHCAAQRMVERKGPQRGGSICGFHLAVNAVGCHGGRGPDHVAGVDVLHVALQRHSMHSMGQSCLMLPAT